MWFGVENENHLCGYTGKRNDEAEVFKVSRHKGNINLNKLEIPSGIKYDYRDDFEWGYKGSAPKQLAFAMLYDHTKDEKIAKKYENLFRDNYVAGFKRGSWFFSCKQIDDFIKEQDASIAKKEAMKLDHLKDDNVCHCDTQYDKVYYKLEFIDNNILKITLGDTDGNIFEKKYPLLKLEEGYHLGAIKSIEKNFSENLESYITRMYHESDFIIWDINEKTQTFIRDIATSLTLNHSEIKYKILLKSSPIKLKNNPKGLNYSDIGFSYEIISLDSYSRSKHWNVLIDFPSGPTTLTFYAFPKDDDLREKPEIKNIIVDQQILKISQDELDANDISYDNFLANDKIGFYLAKIINHWKEFFNFYNNSDTSK